MLELEETVKGDQREGVESHWAVYLMSKIFCISINRNRLDWTLSRR